MQEFHFYKKMKPFYWISIVGLFWNLSSGYGADFVFRPQYQLQVNISSDVTSVSSIEPHLIHNAQEAGEIGLRQIIEWKALPFLFLSSHFKYVAKGGTSKSNEYRPGISCELFSPLYKKLEIRFRHRVEYRNRERKKNYTWYRPRLWCQWEGHPKISGFIYEEFFFSPQGKANRWGLGGRFRIRPHFHLEIEWRYNHKQKNSSEWKLKDKSLLLTLEQEM